MASTQLNLREDILAMIQQMGDHKLLRLKGLVTDLLESEQEDNNWWNDLTEEDKRNIEESDREIDEGNFVTMDEVFARYKHRLK